MGLILTEKTHLSSDSIPLIRKSQIIYGGVVLSATGKSFHKKMQTHWLKSKTNSRPDKMFSLKWRHFFPRKMGEDLIVFWLLIFAEYQIFCLPKD